MTDDLVKVLEAAATGTARSDCLKLILTEAARRLEEAEKMAIVLEKVRQACLFADDDGQVGVTEDPHISSYLFYEICETLNKTAARHNAKTKRTLQ